MTSASKAPALSASEDLTLSAPETLASISPAPVGTKPQKGAAFWLSVVAMLVTTFLSALDLSSVGTALPTIAESLKGSENYVWVGSAYALSSTAILPLSGTLSDIFGRRVVVLGAIAFFALGSALAGAAQNMNMLIAARTIQGIGGGAIVNLSEIVISDLVPLAERGAFQGMFGLLWSFACGMGPPIGGAFAQEASWRWLFYMNLPLTGIAFVLVLFFLRVRTPEGSLREKIARVDWTGNLIVIVGITLAIIGLTWGGIRYPWDSAHVLAPLIIGLCIVSGFILYEAKIPNEPTIPFDIMSNRTSLSGFISTGFHGIVSISLIYFIPVYFQACVGHGPVRSGVDMLATALVVAPGALSCGISVQVTHVYRPVIALGWVLTIIGFGVLTMLEVGSSVGSWVGFQFITAFGVGIIWAGNMFPVLAPLPLSRNATALAFFAFVRAFTQTWGITISNTILQNELKKKLPVEFLSQFPQGLEIAYAAIPKINALEEPLRSQVRVAFAASLSTIWKTMIGISGLGFISMMVMREIPMNQFTDENFGLAEGERPAEARTEEGRKTKVVEESIEEKLPQ